MFADDEKFNTPRLYNLKFDILSVITLLQIIYILRRSKTLRIQQEDFLKVYSTYLMHFSNIVSI